jgi:hypothetical protein
MSNWRSALSKMQGKQSTQPNNSSVSTLKQIKRWFITVQTHSKTSQPGYLIKEPVTNKNIKLTTFAEANNNFMVCY